MQRVIWAKQNWQQLHHHFVIAGRREAGAFLLFRSGRTASGQRLLVSKVLLPPRGALEVQGPDSLRPSGQWLSAVIGEAIEQKCGLAFIHSHPDPYHPPTLSAIDWETSTEWNRSISPMLDGPFASLVWSPRGVTGVIFGKGDPEPLNIERCEAIGAGMIQTLHHLSSTSAPERDDRQIRALSTLGNARVRTLRVGVVGAGGTGSPIADQLARIGVAEIVLVDPDVLEESNLRRITGSHASDVGRKKVDVVSSYLNSLGLGVKVHAVSDDVRHEDTIRLLLDCDVVLNGTDTQSSRALLNQVAYQYWLPVVDVGVRIGTSTSGLISGMPCEIRTLLPDNGCMWCREILDSQRIYEENLPADRRIELAAEGYVQGIPGYQPSLAPLNHFAGALALLAMLRLYSGLPPASMAVVVDPWEQYVHPLKSSINPECICSSWRGRADDESVSFLPRQAK